MAKKELPMELNENTNSYQVSKEEKPEQKKTKANVSIQKESTWKRIRRAFIAEEVTSLKEFTIFDVLVPAVKRTFRDLIVNSIDITLGYGKSGSKSPYKTTQNGSQTYVAYGSSGRYANEEVPGPRQESKKSPIIGPMELDRIKFTILDDFGNVDLRQSHEAAIEALGYLMDILEEGYDVVTVAQFLSYVSNGKDIVVNHIHSKWGWYSLQGSAVVECADGSGYFIRFPKPVPI